MRLHVVCPSHSLCLSVRDFKVPWDCDHIGWNSSKITALSYNKIFAYHIGLGDIEKKINISYERNTNSYVRNTNAYVRNTNSYKRNSNSYVRISISYEQISISFVRNINSFKQISISFVRNTVKLLLNAGSRINAGSLINAGVLRPVF